MSVRLPDIIDLTVENQNIEVTRPQLSPIKIKNLNKTKKKVSFPSIISTDTMSTTITTDTQTASNKISL